MLQNNVREIENYYWVTRYHSSKGKEIDCYVDLSIKDGYLNHVAIDSATGIELFRTNWLYQIDDLVKLMQ